MQVYFLLNFNKKDKNMNKNEITFIGCFGVLAGIATSIFFNGIAIKYLWLWFFVPLGILPITILHSLGISLMVSLFLSNVKRDSNGDDVTQAIASSILFPMIVTIFGYIIHLFM